MRTIYAHMDCVGPPHDSTQLVGIFPAVCARFPTWVNYILYTTSIYHTYKRVGIACINTVRLPDRNIALITGGIGIHAPTYCQSIALLATVQEIFLLSLAVLNNLHNKSQVLV